MGYTCLSALRQKSVTESGAPGKQYFSFWQSDTGERMLMVEKFILFTDSELSKEDVDTFLEHGLVPKRSFKGKTLWGQTFTIKMNSLKTAL